MRSSIRSIIAALVAVAGGAAQASAQTYGFAGTSFIWTAASTGMYKITAQGAQGGVGLLDETSFFGGRGAQVGGYFSLTQGSILYLAVGGRGATSLGGYNGGGGGGSFVVNALNNPMLVAGGGGGIRTGASQNGCDATISQYGVQGSAGNNASTCTDKSTDLSVGGIVSEYSWGSGGAGFFGDGAVDFFPTPARSWLNGLAGGTGSWGSYGATCQADGGFGGGGSGTGCGGGGGGGGYSGGDGGFIAGGGGSFVSGTQTWATAGAGYGDGLIQIETMATVPEPATIALMFVGLGVVGMAARRRKA